MPPRETRTMRYAAVLDAGSSGTRLYMYGWKAWHKDNPSPPQIEELYSVKKGPGLANLFTNPEIASLPVNIKERQEMIQGRVDNYLNHLFDRARTFCARVDVNPESVPLFFLATAGMRDLRDAQPFFYEVLRKCITKSTKKSDFHVEECGSITGEAEALYGWIAANYSLGFFSGYGMRASQTVGYVEMGGASAQIAYKLIPNSATDAALALADANIELANATQANVAAQAAAVANPNVGVLAAAAAAQDKATNARGALQILANHAAESGGLDTHEGRLAKVNIGALEFDLFLASYRVGTDVAREKYDDHVNRAAADRDGAGRATDFSKNRGWSHTNSDNRTVIGGFANPAHFENVKAVIRDDVAGLPQPPAEGRPDPRIVGSSSRSFVGGSNFWYSTRQVFGLNKDNRPKTTHFSFKEYNHEIQLHLGLDWLSAQRRRPKVDGGFLAQAGFTAAWVQRVLFDYFGFEEDGPNVTREDKLTFRPYNGSNGVELSWTLGRIVLYAVGDPKPQQMTGPQARELDYLRHQVKNDDIRWAKLEDDVHDAKIVVDNVNNQENQENFRRAVRERNSLKAGRVARRRAMEAKEKAIKKPVDGLLEGEKFFVDLRPL